MMTSRSARRMAALALFPISLLVATDAAALTYVAGTVPIATAFGQCNEQPDVVWFSGEYVVSYVSRSCPVIGNGDANAELVRVPLGAMPIPVRRLLVDGRTFPDAFVRLGTNGAEALTIVVGRKGLAEWTIHRINAAPGLMNLALATSRVVGPEYDRFEFDCWGGGCGLVGRRRRVDMAYDILLLGIDGDAITPVFFAIREPWISALQVNNERQVLYTNSPVAPRVRRFNLDTGATTPLPPPGVVNVVSVAGARYQNTFVSYSAEQGGAIFRHIEGAADRAPENFTGEFFYQRHRHASFVGRAWPRRNHNAIRLKRRDFDEGDFVIAVNHNFFA